MNGVKTVDLQRLYDPLDTLERERRHEIQRVSNNLGVYFFLFVWFRYSCSFSLSFYASSANKPVFLCFTSPSFGRFLCINKFLQAGYSGFQVTGMIEWGQKSKPKMSLDQNLASKQSHAKFPSHKNFQKGLNDIPSGYFVRDPCIDLYLLFTRDSC